MTVVRLCFCCITLICIRYTQGSKYCDFKCLYKRAVEFVIILKLEDDACALNICVNGTVEISRKKVCRNGSENYRVIGEETMTVAG